MTETAPRNIKEACRIPSYTEALLQLVEKAHAEDVIDDLVSDGLPKDEATRVVQRSARLLASAGNEVGSIEIIGGMSLFLLGSVITGFTLWQALDTGGHVIVAYGAVICGLLSIARGIRLRKTRTRGVLRDRIYEGQQAALAATAMEGLAPKANDKPQRETRYDY